MFTGEELELWLKRGQVQVAEARILRECRDDEPVLMAYWVYRKRIRIAPESVKEAATERMVELCEAAGLYFGEIHRHVFENVCNAIWDQLPDDARQRLMRSI